MRPASLATLLLFTSVSLFAQSAAGLRWTAPAGWKAEAERPMRAATYSIVPATGDTGVAECVVNFFGPGQGGGIDANVERWKSQVLGADGKPAAAKVDKRTVRGVAITMVDASGTYTGMGGPMMAGKPGRIPVDRRHCGRTRRQRVLQADGTGQDDRRPAEKLRAVADVDRAGKIKPSRSWPTSSSSSTFCS
jgi:hypothetical protein